MSSWIQVVALMLFAVLTTRNTVMANDSNNEDLLINLAGEIPDCTSGLCRRNVEESTEIVEKDAISQLSDSFNYDKKALEKRRCMSWTCKVGRTISNDMNFDKDKPGPKRAPLKKRVLKPRRCLTWLCKNTSKRTAKAVENKQESISKHEKKSRCISWRCQRKRRNEKNDSKRLLLKQVLIVRKQRGDHEECLSWDCKRDNISDRAALKREVERNMGSEGRGDRFMEYLRERSFPRFPERRPNNFQYQSRAMEVHRQQAEPSRSGSQGNRPI